MQTFEPWHPVADVPEFLAGVFVVQPRSNCVNVICDGRFADGRLLVLSFEQFDAIATHEELNHRWPGEAERPVLPQSSGSAWTLPFLIVKDSVWAAGSNSALHFNTVPTHYCILSGNEIIDVLASLPPRIVWASVEQVESLLQAAGQLGGA